MIGVNGILLVDKPGSFTSHDIVNVLRRKTGIKKIGHAGTLDPMATGLLVMLLGRATKKAEMFSSADKFYQAEMTLGVKTDSADRTGKVIAQTQFADISRDQIEEVFRKFYGPQSQIPPMYSAKKIGGKKLYKLARAGLEIKRNPQLIDILSLEIMDIDLPKIRFSVKCSKGTYVRTLCEDLGAGLGTFAHMSELRRIACGAFRIEDALGLDQIKNMDAGELPDKIFYF